MCVCVCTAVYFSGLLSIHLFIYLDDSDEEEETSDDSSGRDEYEGTTEAEGCYWM